MGMKLEGSEKITEYLGKGFSSDDVRNLLRILHVPMELNEKRVGRYVMTQVQADSLKELIDKGRELFE
jgi:hypothetical protein